MALIGNQGQVERTVVNVAPCSRTSAHRVTAINGLWCSSRMALPVLEYFAVQRNTETAGSLAWTWFTRDRIKRFFDGPLPPEWLITWFAAPLWNSATTLTPCPPFPSDVMEMLSLLRARGVTNFFHRSSHPSPISSHLAPFLPRAIHEYRNISNSGIKKECIISKGCYEPSTLKTMHSAKARTLYETCMYIDRSRYLRSLFTPNCYILMLYTNMNTNLTAVFGFNFLHLDNTNNW